MTSLKADEAEMRLMVFEAALLAIVSRESTLAVGRKPRSDKLQVLDPPHVHPEYKTEARAVADAVVAEAHRLKQELEK